MCPFYEYYRIFVSEETVLLLLLLLLFYKKSEADNTLVTNVRVGS